MISSPSLSVEDSLSPALTQTPELVHVVQNLFNISLNTKLSSLSRFAMDDLR